MGRISPTVSSGRALLLGWSPHAPPPVAWTKKAHRGPALGLHSFTVLTLLPAS